MKKSILILASLCLFCACEKQNVFTPLEPEKSISWTNTNIQGNLDEQKPRIQDDFYQSVNYDDFQNLKIPNDYFYFGVSGLAQQRIDDEIIQLLSSDEKSEFQGEETLKKIYKQAFDWEKRNLLGIKPALPILKLLQSTKNLDELIDLATKNKRILGTLPFNYNFDVFFDNRYVPSLDVNYIFEDDFENAQLFYKKIFEKFGYSSSSAKSLIQKAADYESQFFVDGGKVREEIVTYLPDYLSSEYSNVPVVKLIEANGADGFIKYGVIRPAALRKFNEFFTEENFEQIKTLCICRFLFQSSYYLDKECFDIRNAYVVHKGTLNSPEYVYYSLMNSIYPLICGKMWLDRFFSEEIKADVQKIAQMILDEYVNHVKSWDWITASTRETTVQRIQNIKIVICYEEEMPTYETLIFDEEKHKSLFDSFMYLLDSRTQTMLNQIIENGKKIEKMEVTIPPQTVNAFYVLMDNSINIMGGMLGGEYYDLNWPIEKKLGYLGTIIAHEITHSYSLCYPNGEFLKVWQFEDQERLEHRLSYITSYFSTKEVSEGIYCNGDLCASEIGADLGSMSIILDIAKKYKDFDYKLFFESYAKCWLNLARPSYFETQMQNVHPFPYLRVNAIVQHFDEFYQAFGVTETDKMFLPKENRLILF